MLDAGAVSASHSDALTAHHGAGRARYGPAGPSAATRAPSFTITCFATV